MGTASGYMTEYEQTIPEISDFLLTGDESDLNKKIQEGIDYNRGIRAEQGQNLAARGEIINRYNSTVDPLLGGLDMDQRERLKGYDTRGNNARAAELGSYMSAREGSVADTVNAWKDSWNTKYQAMSEKQKAKLQLWQMAFDQEKETQRQKEAAAQLAATYAGINKKSGDEKEPANAVSTAQKAMADGLSWRDAAYQVEKQFGKIPPGSGIDRMFAEWYDDRASVTG